MRSPSSASGSGKPLMRRSWPKRARHSSGVSSSRRWPLVDSIPAEEQSNEARGLRATIDRAIKRRRELEQKRQALEEALASIQSLIEAGELARAFERVEDAAKLGHRR